MTQNKQAPPPLLEGEVKVVNVGLESFAEELRSRGVAVVDVAWKPPRAADPKLAALLSKLGS